jgi:type VI secretion system protein ImpA
MKDARENKHYSEAVAEASRLLSPISAEAPAGTSLRYEGTYERVREARREDDASIPQGVWERPLKAANPSVAVRLCDDALASRSKDLQLAVWLADGWAVLEGLRGITRGVALVLGLCERFWETMFPELDGEGDDLRVALIDWLDDNLAQRARLVRLGDERSAFSIVEWERAGTEARGDAASDAPQALSRESMLAKISLTGSKSWVTIRGEVGAALAAVDALEHDLAQRLAALTSLRRCKDVLRAIQAVARDVLRSSGEPEATSSAEDDARAGAPEGAPPSSGTRASGDGPIASRADAYRRLTEAADYLLHTEPHSPVPYLVKRAIVWGNMSLAELLQEFIGNADDLVAVHRLLGMRARDE